tara:strand:- start:1079 stop:1675 length:597 start_codon:yes stop_codon:yes gene_type:complete
MSKTTKRYSLKETSYRFLFEQDEEGEDAADEVFGDDEEADAEDTEGEGAGEAAGDDAEKDVSVSPEEEYELSDSIDQELDVLLVDFEQEARKSAAVNDETSLEEAVYKKLFESAAEDIDLRNFASNVARLVKNYQNLIDWQSVILNKAESFVNNHYGEDTAKVLLDILQDEYDIAKKEEKFEEPETPIAIGARGEGGG